MFADCVDVNISLQKQAHHLRIAVLGCYVQRTKTFLYTSHTYDSTVSTSWHQIIARSHISWDLKITDISQCDGLLQRQLDWLAPAKVYQWSDWAANSQTYTWTMWLCFVSVWDCC